MKINESIELLAKNLAETQITCPENTPLYRIASSVVVMARAYERDSATFYATGDFVNALAGCLYGFGWLHFGIAFGLLVGSTRNSCPFQGRYETIDFRFRQRLEEKERRYARLLATARSSVLLAPDPATAGYDFSSRVVTITEAYADLGRRHSQSGALEDALACYSYGHGWLDAAVTAGLFKIVADRDIFTV
jgi:hypothetical protein